MSLWGPEPSPGAWPCSLCRWPCLTVTAVLWGSCGLVFSTSSSNKCHVDPETEVPGQLPGVWVPCPHSQAGEKPETRQALEQVSLDGHLWAWVGTFAKPSFGGRGCRWVCSGSRLDLGCHLVAGASPGWVGAQGQGHHGGCGQCLLLVTDWDGKTPGSPGAVGCGLSPALASQPLLILPLMRMGFCKLKFSFESPKKSPCCPSREHSHCLKLSSRVPGGISRTAQWQRGGLGCS